LYPVLVHRLAHLFHASFRPRLAAVALALSLALHLHQVGQRTFTSKLLSMTSTQLSLRRVEAFMVGFGRTAAMVREGAVERAMPMGNVAIAYLTEDTATSIRQKIDQYP